MVSKKIVIFFWLQTVYSAWVFLRDAKFFRIPYAVISSVWHGRLFHSLPIKKQPYYVMVTGDQRKDGGMGSLHDVDEDTCEEKPAGDFVIVVLKKEKTFDGRSSIRVFVRAENILRYRWLLKKFYEHPICTREDLLVPGLVIMRRLSAAEMTQKYIDGYTPRFKTNYAFIDNSSGERLNDNFLKMVSVIPIALQARGFDWPSVYVFFAIVLFDFFSYVPNNLWQLFKVFLFYSVKSVIAKLRNPDTRVFFHDFLSTISENFAFCDLSRKCSYRLGCSHVRACGEFLLPPYFTTISDFRPKRQVLALVGDGALGQVNSIEFIINSDRHEWRYQALENNKLNIFFFVNNIEFLRKKDASMAEVEAMYENMRDVEERQFYPIIRATYWGIHVCSYSEFYQSLGNLSNICELSLDPWVSDPFSVCGLNLAKMLHSKIAAYWCKA